ncbi:hypothetical protein RUND412_009833 [Rhizina undulata]
MEHYGFRRAASGEMPSSQNQFAAPSHVPTGLDDDALNLALSLRIDSITRTLSAPSTETTECDEDVYDKENLVELGQDKAHSGPESAGKAAARTQAVYIAENYDIPMMMRPIRNVSSGNQKPMSPYAEYEAATKRNAERKRNSESFTEKLLRAADATDHKPKREIANILDDAEDEDLLFYPKSPLVSTSQAAKYQPHQLVVEGDLLDLSDDDAMGAAFSGGVRVELQDGQQRSRYAPPIWLPEEYRSPPPRNSNVKKMELDSPQVAPEMTSPVGYRPKQQVQRQQVTQTPPEPEAVESAIIQTSIKPSYPQQQQQQRVIHVPPEPKKLEPKIPQQPGFYNQQQVHQQQQRAVSTPPTFPPPPVHYTQQQQQRARGAAPIPPTSKKSAAKIATYEDSEGTFADYEGLLEENKNKPKSGGEWIHAQQAPTRILRHFKGTRMLAANKIIPGGRATPPVAPRRWLPAMQQNVRINNNAQGNQTSQGNSSNALLPKIPTNYELIREVSLDNLPFRIPLKAILPKIRGGQIDSAVFQLNIRKIKILFVESKAATLFWMHINKYGISFLDPASGKEVPARLLPLAYTANQAPIDQSKQYAIRNRHASRCLVLQYLPASLGIKDILTDVHKLRPAAIDADTFELQAIESIQYIDPDELEWWPFTIAGKKVIEDFSTTSVEKRTTGPTLVLRFFSIDLALQATRGFQTDPKYAGVELGYAADPCAQKLHLPHEIPSPDPSEAGSPSGNTSTKDATMNLPPHARYTSPLYELPKLPGIPDNRTRVRHVSGPTYFGTPFAGAPPKPYVWLNSLPNSITPADILKSVYYGPVDFIQVFPATKSYFGAEALVHFVHISAAIKYYDFVSTKGLEIQGSRIKIFRQHPPKFWSIIQWDLSVKRDTLPRGASRCLRLLSISKNITQVQLMAYISKITGHVMHNETVVLEERSASSHDVTIQFLCIKAAVMAFRKLKVTELFENVTIEFTPDPCDRRPPWIAK